MPTNADEIPYTTSGAAIALIPHLFIAQLTGLLTAFSIYDDEHLAGASRQAIVEIYGTAMQSLLTPDPPAPQQR